MSAQNPMPGDVLQHLESLRALIPSKHPNRGRMLQYLANAENAAKRQAELIKTAMDSLSQVQLDIKYLTFDLEATRREKNAARQQWKDWREYARSLERQREEEYDDDDE